MFQTLDAMSQKIVVATGILFNILRMLEDEVPEDDSDSDDEERGKSQACYCRRKRPRICSNKGTGGAGEAESKYAVA